jgi:hypothetical protein
MNNKAPGAGLGILGIALLLVGASMILGTLSASTLVTDFVVLLGLALLVAGCGIFGKEWTKEAPQQRPSLGVKWSVILTFVTTVIVAVTALWAYAVRNDIWTAVSAGALGGLVHEIAQSKGTAFLPDTSPSTADKNGESYLGGLVGIILGGAAGLLTLSASSASVSTQLVVTAFAAGVALKGISDAAASPPKGKTESTPNKAVRH